MKPNLEPVGLVTLTSMTAAFCLVSTLAPSPASRLFQILALACSLGLLLRLLGHDPDKP